jgi:hypothetical protein
VVVGSPDTACDIDLHTLYMYSDLIRPVSFSTVEFSRGIEEHHRICSQKSQVRAKGTTRDPVRTTKIVDTAVL